MSDVPDPVPVATSWTDRGGIDSLVAALGPAQRAAVLAREPVVCVLAGAGTGKTRVLTLRVARRLDDASAHAGHVLVCTFSRKAAGELRRRLWMLGAGGRVEAGTFHRTSLRLVTQYRADHGQRPPVVADRRSILQEVLGSRGGGGRDGGGRDVGGRDGGGRRQRATSGQGRSPRLDAVRLEADIGWAKARLIRPDEYEQAATGARRGGAAAARVADVYARYEAARQRRGVLDLDDLLWHCADLLEDDSQFADAVRWRYRHLFVDELQDLNEAQYRLLRLLLGDSPDLFAVGDPNQSVYGWNGADPGLCARLRDEYPGTRVLRLDANHRCSPQIVRAAATLLDGGDAGAPVSTRPDGPAPRVVGHMTDDDEAAWVARQVWLAHRPGRRWSDIAVLARTNAQLAVVAAALDAERVPRLVAGGDLGPASDVRGWAERPGPGAAAVAGGGVGGGGRARSDDDATGTGDARDAGGDGGARGDADGHRAGVGPGSADGAIAGGDAVVLATFHRAKGLQWPAVFVVGLSDGLVPHASARSRAARAEERRLLYVAMTRAQEQLTCSWATHPDGLAAAPPREASPWLAAVQAVADDLAATAGGADPSAAAEHLRRIRTQLRDDEGEAGDGRAPTTAAGPEAASRVLSGPSGRR